MSKGPPYGDSGPDIIPGQADKPSDRNVHFQNTDFTCGPACLMMAFAALDENYTPCPIDELVIWREATLIMQGQGPAGCGPFGLARVAMRRGFTAEVYEHQAANIIVEMSKNVEERHILSTITRHDRMNAIAEGCKTHNDSVSLALLERLLAEGKQLIALTFANTDGHWVVVHEVKGEEICILDPNKASPEELEMSPYWSDTGYNTVTDSDIPLWMCHGPHESSVLVVISKKKS